MSDNSTKCIDVAKLQSDHRWFVGPDFLCNEGCPIDSKSTKHEINAEIGSCVKEGKNDDFSYLTKNDIACSLHQLPQISQTNSYPNEY